MIFDKHILLVVGANCVRPMSQCRFYRTSVYHLIIVGANCVRPMLQRRNHHTTRLLLKTFPQKVLLILFFQEKNRKNNITTPFPPPTAAIIFDQTTHRKKTKPTHSCRLCCVYYRLLSITTRSLSIIIQFFIIPRSVRYRNPERRYLLSRSHRLCPRSRQNRRSF